eukprot:COSAG02_NODE_1142_length_14267_cov_4.941700_11_plen_61_part_00
MASGKNALLKRAKEAIEASEWAAALEAAQVRREGTVQSTGMGMGMGTTGAGWGSLCLAWQ